MSKSGLPWAALKAERASLAAQGRGIETEAVPIRHVAAVFSVDDQEIAIRRLIALMMLTCDPLAIALTAAASAQTSIHRHHIDHAIAEPTERGSDT